MVSPEPDIFTYERNPADEFILIACDGVFDVLSDEDACFHVRQVQRARAQSCVPKGRTRVALHYLTQHEEDIRPSKMRAPIQIKCEYAVT